MELSSLRSKRFRASSSRKVGTRGKKKGMTGEGEGEGKEGTLAMQARSSLELFSVERSPEV